MMNFRQWREWLQEMDWTQKWFVVLIVIRPGLDALYFLGDRTIFAPLNIIGVATPLLVIWSLNSNTLRKNRSEAMDSWFLVFAVVTLLNAIWCVMFELDISTIRIILKVTIAPILYFYIRRFVRSRRDLEGLLFAFMLGAVLPLGLMVYENVFGQISPGQVNRGEVRFEGIYADVLSYSIYLNFAYIVASFLYLTSEDTSNSSKAFTQFAVVFAIVALGMLSIHHAASWAVFASITTVLVVSSVNPKSIIGLLAVCLVLGLGAVVVSEDVQKNLERLTKVESRIVTGEAGFEKAFHGRGSIWIGYWNYWSEMPIHAQLIGPAFNTDSRSFRGRTVTRNAAVMMSGGMHSDYIRTLFGFGIITFIALAGFIAHSIACALRLRRADRFLVIATIGALLLYAVSNTPLLYAPAQYIAISVIAFAALPKHARESFLLRA